jgi:hypothetical protein
MADTKTKSLEDFIEEYLQNKAKSETAESYGAWLEKKGLNPRLDYSEDIRRISDSYNRGRSTYGINAEKSAELGLTGSGYSEYISRAAKEKLLSDSADAVRTLQSKEKKNVSDYREYVDKLIRSEKRDYRTIVKELGSYGVVDYDTAYKYAVASGLSAAEAKIAAKNVSDLTKNKLRTMIMKAVMSKSLTGSETKTYALSLGFSEEEAGEIAKYAESINEYIKSDFDFTKD